MMSDKEISISTTDRATEALRDAGYVVFPAPVNGSKRITGEMRLKNILKALSSQKPNLPTQNPIYSEDDRIKLVAESAQESAPPLAPKK